MRRILTFFVLLLPFFAVNAAPVPVMVAKVGFARPSARLQATGSITAPKMSELSASVSGHIAAIYFKNGETVKKDQLLIALSHQTEQAQLNYAKAKAAASASLYRRNLAFEGQGKLGRLGVSPLSEQAIANNKAAYLMDKASVNEAKVALNNRFIRAPFAGKLGAVTVSQGDYVTPGEALVNLVSFKKLQVSFVVPESAVRSVTLGEQLILTTPLFPGVRFPARISFIAPAVTPSTRTVSCLADLLPTKHQLQPGAFVQILFSPPRRSHITVIPEQALVPDYPNYVVYQIKNNRAVKTKVQTGSRQDGEVQVTHGVKVGDTIVIAGQENLHNGQAVVVKTLQEY